MENQRHREESIRAASSGNSEKIQRLFERIEALTSKGQELLGDSGRRFSTAPGFSDYRGAPTIVRERRIESRAGSVFLPWKAVRVTPVEENTCEVEYITFGDDPKENLVKKKRVAIDSVSDELIESWIKWCASGGDAIRRKKITMVVVVILVIADILLTIALVASRFCFP